MEADWKSPNTITGDAATGNRYIRREYINEYFWREVKKGNHILFVAPRRVGKTSIMKDLADNPPEGYICMYQDIESIQTKNEFYERLFELFLQCVGKVTQIRKKLLTLWKSFGVEELGETFKLKDREVDYKTLLRKLIPDLAKVNISIVIFLDEFAEVISKLNRKELKDDAIDILHTLREIRSEGGFKNFTLVFAGSIGLQHVIKTIDRLKLINDLHPIHTEALNDTEADQFIGQLLSEATISFSDDSRQYMKNKIAYLLPYYIQLMLEEIDLVAYNEENADITRQTIDSAFDNVLGKSPNFEDWLVRLKQYQHEHFPFINDILKTCAHKQRITLQEIYNLALSEKHNREDDYMDFVEQLINEGYLTEINNSKTYRFLSPFLQSFWLKKFPF